MAAAPGKIITERSVPFYPIDLRAALRALMTEAQTEGNDLVYNRAAGILAELDAADMRCRLDTHDLFVSVVFKEHTPA